MNGLRKIVDYKVLEPYKIWLAYDDGVQGQVDLSEFARMPVFALWKDEAFFKSLKVERGRQCLLARRFRFLPGCALHPHYRS